MESKRIKLLLIEDNPGDAGLIRELLADVRNNPFDLVLADRLSTGLECLTDGGVTLVLLDLSLPDSRGLGTFTKMYTRVPQVPIIVLTGLDDEQLAVQAMQAGAQDYLVKGQMDGNLLVRAVRYAIERHRMLAELRSLSLIDELTGLYNRRGFITLAQQQLNIADRTGRGLLLLFADLDDMKWINDTFGHYEGDQALIKTANILKKNFRKGDIAARIGGDEFVVLAVETTWTSTESITSRLQEIFEAHSAREDCRYKLSISIGIARYDPEYPCSIDELLTRADTLMYEHKRCK